MSRLRLGELVGQSTAKIVVNKDPSKPYIGLEHLAPGSPRVLGSAHSSVSTSTNSIFEPGDILFGKLRPYLKKSAMATFSGYCSTDILVLRATAGTDAAFAARVLQSDPVFAEATATAVGTKMPRTSWRELAKLETFVPPLPEQQLIASILDTVDEVIRKTEEVIAKLQQMKQGLLHDLLTRGIDDNGELRDPDRHPEQFKDSPLGRIPKDWEVEALGAFLVGRPTNGLYKPPHEIGSGMLIVGQTAFTTEDSVDFREARRARITNSEYARYAILPGDILVTRVYATVDGVGRPVIVPKSSEPAVYESNMMRVRIKNGEFDPRLLHAWMRGFRARGHVLAKAHSSNQTSINQGAIVSMPCPKPGSAEQDRMVASIDAAESRVREEQAELAKLRLLKSGLMDDLLTGRVRVADLVPTTPTTP